MRKVSRNSAESLYLLATNNHPRRGGQHRLGRHSWPKYEEILKANRAELGLGLDDVDQLLNAVCARAEEWPLAHGWEPILHDPDDEPLVQLAVESGANGVITHNVRDLAPARALGIEVLKPRRVPGETTRKLIWCCK